MPPRLFCVFCVSTYDEPTCVTSFSESPREAQCIKAPHLATGSRCVAWTRITGAQDPRLVPDADGLDPADEDITLTSRVRVNGESLDDDSYDVVRKGHVTTSGGAYKMEIVQKVRTSDPTFGKLHCLFKGTGGIVNRVAPPDIVDGDWHTLECVKTSTSVEARVDGRAYARTDSAGSISNGSEVVVGANRRTRSTTCSTARWTS